MYPWTEGEPRWRYLRRVQLDKKTVETKRVNSKTFTKTGVLAGRVGLGLVSAISNSAIKVGIDECIRSIGIWAIRN
jgi:hypothetical protein